MRGDDRSGGEVVGDVPRELFAIPDLVDGQDGGSAHHVVFVRLGYVRSALFPHVLHDPAGGVVFESLVETHFRTGDADTDGPIPCVVIRGGDDATTIGLDTLV